ncbi:hypothetical protein SZN_31419 [Streptomyces zinciresistens K42]|uniref:Uncharacterized protein n=1 Tax=Streptomyces zinciresistens K42 TaxID=700597 RepID=G2GL88_9ACTN|nr:hypothetical protein SZN_31419 [Streptomyces zinciresistens K42]
MFAATERTLDARERGVQTDFPAGLGTAAHRRQRAGTRLPLPFALADGVAAG